MGIVSFELSEMVRARQYYHQALEIVYSIERLLERLAEQPGQSAQQDRDEERADNVHAKPY